MKSTLSAHDLTLWRGDRCLVRNLSFELKAGEALQLVGVNGSGKTTLLRALAGLGRLDAGELRWNGVALRRSEDYAGCLTYIGHLNGLKSHLNPLENINFYQSIAWESSEITADEMLARLGLSEVAHRPTGLLSMGQRRRAALCRLFIGRARVWLLDEPVSSVDADGVDLVADLIRRHREGGGLAVFTTHQPLPLPGLAPRQLHMAEVGG